MNSFKTPQPSPSGVVLSLARALGIVSSVDDVVIVPLSQWHAMQERHALEMSACEEKRARTNNAMQQRHSDERQLDRDNMQALHDKLDEARRLLAHRDERIAELNAWLDSHAPMVSRE